MFSNYGSFIPDEAVTSSFETFQFDPDVSYYFSGSDVCPNAIMGLKKSFALDNSLWKPLTTNSEKARDQIQMMQLKAGETGSSLQGFIMMAANGLPIGLWYSLPFVRMVVRMGHDNQVVVYTPNMHVYG